jgi:hypothetical protein
MKPTKKFIRKIDLIKNEAYKIKEIKISSIKPE